MLNLNPCPKCGGKSAHTTQGDNGVVFTAAIICESCAYAVGAVESKEQPGASSDGILEILAEEWNWQQENAAKQARGEGNV